MSYFISIILSREQLSKIVCLFPHFLKYQDSFHSPKFLLILINIIFYSLYYNLTHILNNIFLFLEDALETSPKQMETGPAQRRQQCALPSLGPRFTRYWEGVYHLRWICRYVLVQTQTLSTRTIFGATTLNSRSGRKWKRGARHRKTAPTVPWTLTRRTIGWSCSEVEDLTRGSSIPSTHSIGRQRNGGRSSQRVCVL